MIQNEFQFGVTKSRIQDLKDGIVFLENFEGDGEFAKPTAEELKMDVETIESVIWDLEQQIEEYLKIKNGTKAPVFPENVAQIGDFVVQLRIAANLTQAELARLVHTRTQVIQRYEANSYATASISRVNEIVEALRDYRKSHPAKGKSARVG